MNSFFSSLIVSCLVLFLAASSCLAQVATPSSASSPANAWGLSFGNKPRPQNARTIIDAEEGAWFDDINNTVEFSGKVVVKDPQFTLTCDRLNVVLNKNRQGIKVITATGNVVIKQQSTNEQGEKVTSMGKGGIVIYEPGTGDITLKLWPQVQQGTSFQVATEEGTVMVLNNKGTFHTVGQSRTMILDPGAQGGSTDKRVP